MLDSVFQLLMSSGAFGAAALMLLTFPLSVAFAWRMVKSAERRRHEMSVRLDRLSEARKSDLSRASSRAVRNHIRQQWQARANEARRHRATFWT